MPQGAKAAPMPQRVGDGHRPTRVEYRYVQKQATNAVYRPSIPQPIELAIHADALVNPKRKIVIRRKEMAKQSQ